MKKRIGDIEFVGGSLEDMFSEEEKGAYDYLHNLVLVSLYSRFPDRKKIANENLRKAFKDEVVQTFIAVDDDYEYSFISLRDQPTYIFVGKYRSF